MIMNYEIKNCTACPFYLEGDPHGGTFSSYSDQCSFYQKSFTFSKDKPSFCEVKEIAVTCGL